jgi:hypothetical protein
MAVEEPCSTCGSTGHPTWAHYAIPVRWLDGAALRRVSRDGETVWKFRCPACHQWGDIDDDQLHGLVSIDHTGTGCTFHETHILSAALPAAYTATVTKRNREG